MPETELECQAVLERVKLLSEFVKKGRVALTRRALFIGLFMSVLFTGAALAEPAISDYGFRGIKWGATVKDILMQQASEMLLLDFDRDKKLYSYMQKNETHVIYDMLFHPVHYKFWDDKFAAVLANFNAGRDQLAFQRLYENLVAQFGASKRIENQKGDGEGIVAWQSGETVVWLAHNHAARNGYLYIYNEKLQNDYAEFVKTLPATTGYPNQPDGFDGMLWGQDKRQLESAGQSFRPNRKKSWPGEFTIRNDNNVFLDVPVLGKTYGFWQNKLFCSYVFYPSDDGRAVCEQIMQKLTDNYGEPTNGRYSPGENAQYYVWAGDKTYIMLYYFPDKKESYVFITSTELYTQRQANR